ncbi:hypothetical protein OHA40_02690 [Nocardia sp. NBC_00508]|nr:hypothetical protein [Nocardia sp. NBC_00508]WUD67087.1 hypothetical protein OHA40_02690 [Nocardia sp. NBC_00508]
MLFAQRAQLDDAGAGFGCDRCEKPVDVPQCDEVVGPRADQDEHRKTGESSGQRGQQRDGVLVCGVEIIDREDGRLVRREPVDEAPARIERQFGSSLEFAFGRRAHRVDSSFDQWRNRLGCVRDNPGERMMDRRVGDPTLE